MTKKPPSSRVLVVDDEPLIRWSLSETLIERGVDVTEAGDGRAAVGELEHAAHPFDAVLLDLRLPDVDDLSLLAWVRRFSPHARVILMTAFGTPEVLQQAQDLGVFCVVSKPFEVDEIADLVTRR